MHGIGKARPSSALSALITIFGVFIPSITFAATLHRGASIPFAELPCEDRVKLDKRSDAPMSQWTSSSYSSYQPPAVIMPEVYGLSHQRNAYFENDIAINEEPTPKKAIQEDRGRLPRPRHKRGRSSSRRLLKETRDKSKAVSPTESEVTTFIVAPSLSKSMNAASSVSDSPSPSTVKDVNHDPWKKKASGIALLASTFGLGVTLGMKAHMIAKDEDLEIDNAMNHLRLEQARRDERGDDLFQKRSDNYLTPWNAPQTSYQPPAIDMPEMYSQHVYQPPPMPKEGMQGYLDYHDGDAISSDHRRRRHRGNKGKQVTRKLLEDTNDEKGTLSDDENSLVIEGLAPSPMEDGANWDVMTGGDQVYRPLHHDSLGKKIAGIALGVSTVGLTAATAMKVYMNNLAHQDEIARAEAERVAAGRARLRQRRVENEATTSTSDQVLQKRGDHYITRWDPYYNASQAPTVDLPEVYGQSIYVPPPMPRFDSIDSNYEGYPPPPIMDKSQEAVDEKKKKQKMKKSNRRAMIEYGTVGASHDKNEYQGEVPAGQYGYPTGNTDAPYVCGPEADRIYGQYGAGGSTLPMGPHGFDPSLAKPGLNQWFNGARVCDGVIPYKDGEVLNGGAGTSNLHSQGGDGDRYGSVEKGQGHHVNAGAVGGAVAAGIGGTVLLAGGGYIAHRRHQKKSQQDQQSSGSSEMGTYHDEQVYYQTRNLQKKKEWKVSKSVALQA